ncbi:MAG: hypothetical protein ACFFCS_18535, partial [Candidatus Hodarchaeota archaeon]
RSFLHDLNETWEQFRIAYLTLLEKLRGMDILLGCRIPRTFKESMNGFFLPRSLDFDFMALMELEREVEPGVYVYKDLPASEKDETFIHEQAHAFSYLARSQAGRKCIKSFENERFEWLEFSPALFNLQIEEGFARFVEKLVNIQAGGFSRQEPYDSWVIWHYAFKHHPSKPWFKKMLLAYLDEITFDFLFNLLWKFNKFARNHPKFFDYIKNGLITTAQGEDLDWSVIPGNTELGDILDEAETCLK